MGTRIKLTLGKKNPKEIDMPDINDMLTHPKGESLVVFGSIKYQNATYRQLYGIGVVFKIKHSEKFDCVYMKFGNPKELRKIIVIDNHARRQLITLKRSHIAHFYGYAKVCHFERKDKSGNYTKWQLYALGFQDWYVPRSLEVKKTPRDETDIEDMSINEEQYLENFIDQFDITGEE